MSINESTEETGITQSAVHSRTTFPVDINPAIQHVPLTTPRQYTRQMIAIIAESHGLKAADIFCKNGHRGRTCMKVAIAKREAIVAVIQSRPHLSYPDLGRIFGLDHTTILHHARLAGLPRRKRPPGSAQPKEEAAA